MPELKRSVSFALITFYGLGTILGAGIYVLTGVVAGKAGVYTPLSFLFAAIVAAPTALTYGELAARFPRAAGAALYVDEAFTRAWLTRVTGIAVASIGIVSAATIARGFVGYLDVFVVLPDALVIFLVVVSLGGLAAWGISQSVVAAMVVTIVELLGLLLIIGLGFGPAVTDPVAVAAPAPPLTWAPWAGVFAGAFLAFYAFLGFEDIVNLAEETKDPSKNMPRAIVLSLVVATILYLLTTWVAVRTVALDDLAASEAPMSLVVQSVSGFPPTLIALISLLAVVNGALVQIIMASRVMYGMAQMDRLPGWLSRIGERTRTPVNATALTTALVLLLGVSFEIEALASITSSLTLLVFAGINLALIVVRRQGPDPAEFTLPLIVPVFGLVTSLALFVASFLPSG